MIAVLLVVVGPAGPTTTNSPKRERKGLYRVLVGKPNGRRPLGRLRPKWEDNIKIDLQEVGCGGTDWIELAQDRDR